MKTEDLNQLIFEILDEGKATDIILLDLNNLSNMIDYMFIVTGRSNRHISSLADKVSEAVKKQFNIKSVIEGERTSDWILIDTFTTTVNLMTQDVREFYALEKLWGASGKSNYVALK